jgi:membrane protein YqaA with SNARE-associated domain
MLRGLYNWTMGLAGNRHALWWMALVSFIESSIFPIPPDVMLVPMVLAQRERAWRIAAVCTVASVIGGFLGYAIGFFLLETIGAWVINVYHLEAKFAAFQQAFQDYGVWIVLIKGMTPIPYKLITIAAGAAKMNLAAFAIASVVSRGMRFFLVAALLWKFGAPIRDFIERRLTLVTTTFVVALVGGFVVVKWIPA